MGVNYNNVFGRVAPKMSWPLRQRPTDTSCSYFHRTTRLAADAPLKDGLQRPTLQRSVRVYDTATVEQAPARSFNLRHSCKLLPPAWHQTPSSCRTTSCAVTQNQQGAGFFGFSEAVHCLRSLKIELSVGSRLTRVENRFSQICALRKGSLHERKFLWMQHDCSSMEQAMLWGPLPIVRATG